MLDIAIAFVKYGFLLVLAGAAAAVGRELLLLGRHTNRRNPMVSEEDQ